VYVFCRNKRTIKLATGSPEARRSWEDALLRMGSVTARSRREPALLVPK